MIELIEYDTYGYETVIQRGTYGAGNWPQAGNWKWDAENNTWALEAVNEVYAAPESTKPSTESEQARMWELLKQAAGG